MRIAYFTASIIPSRTANSVHAMKMAHAMASLGHEVTLFVPNRAEEAEPDIANEFSFYDVEPIFALRHLPYVHPQGSRVRNLYSHACYWLAAYKAVKNLLPDLVYGRDLCACHAGSVAGCPVIAEYHAPVGAYRLERFFYQKLLMHPKTVRHVVISKRLRDIFVTQLGLPPKITLVAHDGADVVADMSPPARWVGRKNALQIGYVGGLYPGRGTQLLFDLASRNPDMDFHIVGGDKADIQHAKAECQTINVHFHGHLPYAAAQQCRNACDILLAPYRSGLQVAQGGGDTSDFMSPLKIFEYMASGKAILASDMPALREILDERCARFAPPADLDGWHAALQPLRKQSLRQQLGQAALALFQAHYSWKHRAEYILINAGVAP